MFLQAIGRKTTTVFNYLTLGSRAAFQKRAAHCDLLSQFKLHIPSIYVCCMMAIHTSIAMGVYDCMVLHVFWYENISRLTSVTCQKRIFFLEVEYFHCQAASADETPTPHYILRVCYFTHQFEMLTTRWIIAKIHMYILSYLMYVYIVRYDQMYFPSLRLNFVYVWHALLLSSTLALYVLVWVNESRYMAWFLPYNFIQE